jgi:hypothetical protein
LTVSNCDNSNSDSYESLSCDLSSVSEGEYFCKSTSKKPLVDWENCETNTQCASGVCGNGTFFQTCIGKAFNTTCESTIECESELYCDLSQKKCQYQKSESSTCKLDEECENLSGCLNGICTRYWSLPGLTSIGNSQLAEIYCESGFQYNGQCMSPVNLDDLPYNCEKSCKYNLLENNQNITLNEMCSCGYNSDGLKFCQHGVQSIVFQKYVELSKTILKKGCHVSKKFDCESEIDEADVLQRRNYYLAWKGKFQLTNECIILFFANAKYLHFYIISFMYMYFFILF